MANNVRKAIAAGSFYPGDKARLQSVVEDLLAEAELPSFDGRIQAVMAPHAGYAFSAGFAAPAYKAIGQSDCDTIVIIGHDFGPQASRIIAILDDHEAFDTPLGPVAVDTEMVKDICQIERRAVVYNPVHAREHSIEVHLPFIKCVKPDARIVPVLFGEATPENCRAFANAIGAAARARKMMILASTDLSHYPPYDVSRELDAQTVSFIEKMDLAGLCRWQRGEGVSYDVETPICSAGGVGTAIAWCENEGNSYAKILKMGSSGDAKGGEKDSVVGYASAVFVQK